jgi:hypothetical protein
MAGRCRCEMGNGNGEQPCSLGDAAKWAGTVTKAYRADHVQDVSHGLGSRRDVTVHSHVQIFVALRIVECHELVLMTIQYVVEERHCRSL